MPMLDPAAIVASYNGITLNITSYHNSKCTARPVPDEAKRVTKGVEYTYEFQAYVVAASDITGTTDNQMATLRKRLTQPGQPLIISGLGYGPLNVNSSLSPVRDMAWGPIPEILDWQPRGWQSAADITWRVTTLIPECDSALYRNGIAALCYDVDWDIDVDGYTSRTIKGYLEIPLTRSVLTNPANPAVAALVTANPVQDSADAYRTNGKVLWPTTPTSFQRQGGGNWHLSMDRRRLDFTFVDKEMPAALPDNTTTAEVDHTYRNTIRFGEQVWEGSIGGTLILAKNKPKGEAWARIKLIVNSRLKSLSQIKNKNAQGGPKNPGEGNYIPAGWEFGESVFGRTSHFRFTYMIFGKTLAQVLQLGRMWQPIDGTSFQSWKASLENANGPNKPRGFAGLAYNPKDDLLIDLCTNGNPPPPARVLRTQEGTQNPKPGQPPDDELGAKIDNPEESWLRYNIHVGIHELPGRVLHKPLRDRPVKDPPAPPPPKPSASQNPQRIFYDGAFHDELGNIIVDDEAPAADPGDEPDNDGPDAIVQNVTGSTYIITIWGNAMRCGYRIPVPELLKFGGLDVFLFDREFDETEFTRVGNVPIYLLHFRLRYWTKKKPPDGALFVPPNPWLGSPGVSGKVTFKGVTKEPLE
jgi:hypothetical protein